MKKTQTINLYYFWSLQKQSSKKSNVSATSSRSDKDISDTDLYDDINAENDDDQHIDDQ